LAIKILERSFEYFTNKKYKKLQAKFDITEQELKEAIEEVVKLNPKPGSSFNSKGGFAEHIIPDFTVMVEDDIIDLSLNAKNAPELHVSRGYTKKQ